MSEFWGFYKVRFELNGPEVYWLKTQSGFCSDAVVELLKAAFEEWLLRNTERCVTQETVTAILREALDEFIARHKAEFL